MRAYLPRHLWFRRMARAVVTTTLSAYLCTLLVGCGGLGAQAGMPGISERELELVPYDSHAPVIVIVPERVKLLSKEGDTDNLMPSEDFLTAMLTSELARYQNFKIMDSSRIPAATALRSGQQGPYRVQVILTEMDPYSKVDYSGLDPWDYENPWHLLWKPPLTLIGFWTSMLTGLPSVFTSTEIAGVVGLEVVTTDMRSNQIAASFSVHGTHIEKGRQVGNPLFGAYVKREARSTFSGASREAINSAVEKIFNQLVRGNV